MTATASSIPFAAETFTPDALPRLLDRLTKRSRTPQLSLQRIEGDVKGQKASAYFLAAYRQANGEGIRCMLLEGMAKTQDASLLPWLTERLYAGTPAERAYALWAIGELRLPKTLPLLEKEWAGSSRERRLIALDAFGKQPSPKTVRHLKRALESPDVQTRFVAATALGRPENTSLNSWLLDRLQRESQFDVQEALARSLGQAADEAMVQKLAGLLNQEKSPELEHWMGLALKEAKPSYVMAALTPQLTGGSRLAQLRAARILGALASSEVSPVLLDMLRRGKPDVQVVILSSIPRGARGAVADEVLRLLTSRHASVRAAAAQAVERMAPSLQTLEPEVLP